MTTVSLDNQTVPDYARFAIGFDHARSRAPARADRRGDRLQPLVRGRHDGALRGGLGGATTGCRRWPPRAGRAARWPRCTSPASRARPCCARRTRSWRRRWRRSTPARASQFVDCNREDLCMSFADFEAKAEKHKPQGGVPRPHRRPHRVRLRADRRVLRRERDLPDRGLRPRARRRVERAQAGHLRRRRRLLAVRDQDDLDRRGRRARLQPARAHRARPRASATTASPATRSRASTSA